MRLERAVGVKVGVNQPDDLPKVVAIRRISQEVLPFDSGEHRLAQSIRREGGLP